MNIRLLFSLVNIGGILRTRNKDKVQVLYVLMSVRLAHFHRGESVVIYIEFDVELIFATIFIGLRGQKYEVFVKQQNNWRKNEGYASILGREGAKHLARML